MAAASSSSGVSTSATASSSLPVVGTSNNGPQHHQSLLTSSSGGGMLSLHVDSFNELRASLPTKGQHTFGAIYADDHGKWAIQVSTQTHYRFMRRSG